MSFRKAVLGVACVLVSSATLSAFVVAQQAQVSIIIDRPCDFVWRNVGASPVTLMSKYLFVDTTASGVVRGTGSGNGNKVGDQIFVDYAGFRFTHIITEKDATNQRLSLVQLSSNEFIRAWRNEFALTPVSSAACRVSNHVMAFADENLDFAQFAQNGLENLKAYLEALP